MILVRTVFQAKWGKAAELAEEMVEGNGRVAEALGLRARARVLTDLSGPFNTVVFEVEVHSLAEWEQTRTRMFASPQFQEANGRTSELIESGRLEFYNIHADFEN